MNNKKRGLYGTPYKNTNRKSNPIRGQSETTMWPLCSGQDWDLESEDLGMKKDHSFGCRIQANQITYLSLNCLISKINRRIINVLYTTCKRCLIQGLRQNRFSNTCLIEAGALLLLLLRYLVCSPEFL